MELPPKALHALIDIKKELLSRTSEEPRPETPDFSNRWERLPHGDIFPQRSRLFDGAFQSGCRRRAFWAPVH